MPAGKHVKISYLLKALNITDINDAWYLEITLKSLANQGLVEKEMQEGKFYYKRRA